MQFNSDSAFSTYIDYCKANEEKRNKMREREKKKQNLYHLIC